MGGENKMTVGLAVELLANLVQQVMLFGFLYLFFDKPFSKSKNILFFSLFVLGMFAMESYFSFHEMTFVHLDTIIIVVSMILYAILCLRGAVYLRIIMPLVVYGLNMIVSFSVLFSMTYLGNKTLEESVAFSTSFRYLYILIVDLIYFFLLWSILRVSRKKLLLNNIYDVLAYIIVPVLCMVGMYVAVIIYEKVDFNQSVLPMIMILLFVLIAISVLVWLLLVKTSKDNKIKTDLLLSQQREELYRNSVIATNIQIEKLSEIKHDINNHLMSASELISEGESEKAKEICDNMSQKLSAAHTPIHTENPVLNAILNVEMEKAVANCIDFSYDIQNALLFVKDSDIISIIGNLCDNAIEYLSGLSENNRVMSLLISVYRNYYCITCKNRIQSSVLHNNPDLKTTKDDDLVHGKGITILRSIAEKYNGEVLFSEEENHLIASMIIRERN
jgi:hypothetical protein